MEWMSIFHTDADGGGESVSTGEKAQPEITPEALEEVLKNAAEDHPLKKWIQSKEDKRVSQALETWKKNNLSEEIEKEIVKRFPAETEEQKEIRKLREENERMKTEHEKLQVERELTQRFRDQGLPEELAVLVAAADKELAEKRFEMLSTILKKWKERLLGTKRQESGKPPAATGSTRSGENPFKTNNLTEIARLMKEDPVLAKQLADDAGKSRMFQHMNR
jgi:hypothetical protein